MLFWSLFFGAILWAIGLAALRWPGWWTAAFTLLGLVSLLGMPFPPVALLFLSMGLVLCFGRFLRRHPRLGLTASVGAFVAPYVILSISAKQEAKEMARLRDMYPFESIDQRLPKHPHLVPPQKLSTEATDQLDRLENDLFAGNERAYTLEVLHRRQIRDFIDSPGFGAVRMMRPREEYLKTKLPDKPVPQPTPVRASAGKLDDEPYKPQPPEPSFVDLHREGVVDFANEEGFGYVKDREHVAGFRPHRFTEVPQPRAGWSVASVELIGLLLHPRPVAYVSENLPRMEDLRKAPTRELDNFEKAGLASLVAGNELFHAETPTGRRMLGAVRAAKPCLQCHEGERGTLLGAFSYWLREGKASIPLK